MKMRAKRPVLRESPNLPLVLGRGSAFAALLVILVLLIFFAAFLAVIPAKSPADKPGKDLGAATFASLAALALGALLYYRPDRTLEVDDRGIRLFRGRRLQRDLPWADIARVRFGPRVGAQRGFPGGYILQVGGRRPWQRISLTIMTYGVDWDRMMFMASAIGSTAKQRGIHVVELNPLEAGKTRV